MKLALIYRSSGEEDFFLDLVWTYKHNYFLIAASSEIFLD